MLHDEFSDKSRENITSYSFLMPYFKRFIGTQSCYGEKFFKQIFFSTFQLILRKKLSKNLCPNFIKNQIFGEKSVFYHNRIYRKVPSFEGRKGELYVLKETLYKNRQMTTLNARKVTK